MGDDAKLSVVCLGTGKGASMVYDGYCSSSYVLCANGRPIVLFGTGYGVTRQCLRYFGIIPLNIVIFSNRSHMSAELPVILDVESHKGRHLNIITEVVVMGRLQQHRLAETHARLDLSTLGENSVCNLVALRDVSASHTKQASCFHLPDAPSISLTVFSVPATEASCGVVVHHHDVPVLAITGDCAYDAVRHREILSLAPVIICDGRKKGSVDHASFQDIMNAVEECKVVPRRVFIGQYGQPMEAPPVLPDSIVSPIVEGAVVSLSRSGLSIADAEEVLPSFSEIRPHSGGNQVGYRPKKVFFIEHDNPDTPPALIMVQQFRTIAQVKQRVSVVLKLRPLGDFFLEESGEKIKDISQFEHGKRVIVTRIGGRPFDKLSPKSMPIHLDEENSLQKNGDTVVQRAESDYAPATVGFDDYMRKAYHLLQRPTVSLNPPLDRGVSGDSGDSPPWTKTEVSPVSPSLESTEREEPKKISAVSSLRFTTLRA